MSALESLLFAKYQMYRNVYWHHAVRSATCMFKRAVRGAVARGSVDRRGDRRGHRRRADGAADHPRRQRAGRGHPRAAAVQARARPARQRRARATREPWIADDPDLLERVEDALAREVGLAPGELLLDFPGALVDARRGPAAPDPRRRGRAAHRRRPRRPARPAARGRRALPERPPPPRVRGGDRRAAAPRRSRPADAAPPPSCAGDWTEQSPLLERSTAR